MNQITMQNAKLLSLINGLMVYLLDTSRNVNHYDIKGSTQVENGEPDYATLDRGRVGTSASSRHYEFESEPVPNPVYRVS